MPRYRRSPDRHEELMYRRENYGGNMVPRLGSEDWHTGVRWERPGSAPAAHVQQPHRITETSQRSLSLPKCFQAGREQPRPPRLAYQWVQCHTSDCSLIILIHFHITQYEWNTTVTNNILLPCFLLLKSIFLQYYIL